MKKISIIVLSALLALLLTGCNQGEKNIEGDLKDIMSKMYSGIKEDNLPKLMNADVTKENLSSYLGVESLDYKEAIASEPMIGSIPHSVVLIRMNDNADIEKAKKEIQEKVNPRKWICVEVPKEDVRVLSKGNLILLIMVNENRETIEKNFKDLK
ncbi:MAG: hypothetical protein RSB41_00220 [Bacilli bacterium]